MGLPRSVVALAGVVFVLAGCTSSPIIAQGKGLELPVEGFAEVNLWLSEGDTVQWSWEATQSMRFDVHTHAADGGVTVLVAREGLMDKSTFTAGSAGGYSLMWVNIGAGTGRLDYRIVGEGGLDTAHLS